MEDHGYKGQTPHKYMAMYTVALLDGRVVEVPGDTNEDCATILARAKEIHKEQALKVVDEKRMTEKVLGRPKKGE